MAGHDRRARSADLGGGLSALGDRADGSEVSFCAWSSGGLGRGGPGGGDFRDARHAGKPEPKVSGTCCAPTGLLLKERTYGCAGEPVPTRFALARGQSGLLRE
jgi:hypothetical protein